MITQIVSSTDMKGRFKLDLPSNLTDWNDFVQENEYKILIDLFGAELYKTFDDDETAEIWTNLLNGVDNYQDYNGIKRDWKGLKKMLIRYMYAEWIILPMHTRTGIVQEVNENSQPLNPYQVKKISDDAYNEFMKEYYNAYNYIYSNSTSYPNFTLYFKNKQPRGGIISVTVK